MARLEADAKKAPAAVRADILYPVDRMRQVNRGRLELQHVRSRSRFPGRRSGRRGGASGQESVRRTRPATSSAHYLLDSAGEIMPYRMYVPTTYNGSSTFPLIVALHGLGGTEDSFFTATTARLPKLAEQHGYIVAAPLGYRVDGLYGWGVGNPPADPATRRVQENSEKDVMQVLQLVRQQDKIDENRIYLMGHSMGAIGTWKIAPKFPDIWAAIGMFAGSGAPATLERIKHIPRVRRARRRGRRRSTSRARARWWRS